MSDRASEDNGPTVGTGSSKAPVGPLLRPNALPTDTAVLFLLLVITFVTSSLYLFQFLYVGLNARTFGDTMVRCASASPPGGGKLTSVVMAEVDAFTACTAEVSKEEVSYALVGALLVVVIAWILYRLRPAWRERRGGLEPAEGPDLVYLKGGVDALAAQASVAAPAVLLDPANPSVSAFAYGAGKELRIGVTGGLVVQQSLDPPMFDAVVRHELGHLANRDVPWTFYTLSAWWSFLVAALLPVTLVALVNARQYLLQLGLRVAALTVMLGVVGAALLRIREAYADARAAEWGSGGAMDAILQAQREPKGGRPEWLRTHPSPTGRRQLLADPDGLFRVGWIVPVATGIAAGTSFAALDDMVGLVLPTMAALLVAAVPVAVLVAGIVCIEAWRVSLREAVRGVREPIGVRLGVGLGIGLAVGPLLTLRSAMTTLIEGTTGWVGYVVWAACLVLVVTLLQRWVADSSRIRVASLLARQSPIRPLLAHVTVVAAAMVLVLLVGSISLRVLTIIGLQAVDSIGLYGVIDYPGLSFWPLALAVAMLAVTVVSGRDLNRSLATPDASHGSRSWYWLQPNVPPMPPPRGMAPPSMARLTVVGVLVGAVAAITLVDIRLVGLLSDVPTRQTDAFKLVLGEGSLYIVSGAFVVASVAGAVASGHRWWSLGLLPGFVALALTSTLAQVLNLASGCGFMGLGGACGLPTFDELWMFYVLPAERVAGLVLVLIAVVGVIDAVVLARPTSASRATSGRPSVPRVVLVSGGAMVAMAILGTWQATRPIGVSEPRIAGVGYSMAVPPTWQPAEDPSTHQVGFLDAAGDVLVVLQPVSGPAPAMDGRVLAVGGRSAALVADANTGFAEVQVYLVEGSRGWIAVKLQGTPESLDLRRGEIDSLLQGVVWDQ